MSTSAKISVLAWPVGHRGDENPYVRLMYMSFKLPYVTLIAFKPLMRCIPKADVFHIHWPEGVFEGRIRAILLGVRLKSWRVLKAAEKTRRNGGIVVLTIHNIVPHRKINDRQSRFFEKFHERLLNRTDLMIGLSESSLVQFVKKHPAASSIRGQVIHHPHYRTAYPPAPDRNTARTLMRLPGGFILGVIGAMRSSKRIPSVILAFRAIAREDEILLIAGSCDDEALWHEIMESCGSSSQILVRRRALSEAEIVAAIGATDACLINQSSMLNSGSALLVLSMNRPLIAPDVGSLAELQGYFGNRWVNLFRAPLSEAAFRESLNQIRERSSYDDIVPMDELDPVNLSNLLLKTFTSHLKLAVHSR